MSGKIFSPKKLVPSKVKVPSENLTTIVPDKDHGNRLTVAHSNGKFECLEDFHKVIRSNKDTDGLYTIVSYYDTNDVVRKTSILSKSGTHINPDVYDIRTVTYYDPSGIQTLVEIYTQIYDIDGEWTGEVLS